MAENRAAAESAPAAEHVSANRLSSTQSFYRILYNGNSTNMLKTKFDHINFADIEELFECAIEMARVNIDLPLAAIKKAYEMKTYWDVRYIMAALAYCAKQKHVLDLKNAAYKLASELIDNQTDFMMFVKYCRKNSQRLNNLGDASAAATATTAAAIIDPNDNEPIRLGGGGFGQGMRKMILRWYGKYEPVQLANMFGEHRGMCHLTHRRTIMKAHLRTDGEKQRFKKNRKRINRNDDGAGASTNPVHTEPTNDHQVASTSRATPPISEASVQVIAPETDRDHVFEFVILNGTKYLERLTEVPEHGPGAQRMKCLQILKTNMNIEAAADSILENNFTVNQMPAHLLESDIIWGKLLPGMTMKQCLKYFHTIRDFGFLNPDATFVDQYVTQLDLKKNELKKGDICPIALFIMIRLYEKNVRYLGATKADWYQKKAEKRKLVYNEMVKTHLDSYFNLALSGVPMKSSTKYFFTVDLRMGNSKKHVNRNKHIFCHEALVFLAYSTFEREKDVSIYAFSDKSVNDLQDIHSLLKHDNYKYAQDIFNLKRSQKTYQSLWKPIAQASEMEKQVDIFVVIVDSVARFCRQGQVPELEFAEYKAKFNPHAKFLVINLARPTHDLQIPTNENMMGFFEVCGFNETTPKIMNALATHSFR